MTGKLIYDLLIEELKYELVGTISLEGGDIKWEYSSTAFHDIGEDVWDVYTADFELIEEVLDGYDVTFYPAEQEHDYICFYIET